MSRETPSSSDRNVATAIAGAGLVLCCVGLLAMIAMIIPDVLWVIAVVAGMALIGALQYVTWGWRLDRDRIKDDQPQQ